MVEGPSKTDIHVEDNDDNTCTVSYTPMLPGDYQVFIKFANRDIAGSPFSTKIIPASGRLIRHTLRLFTISLSITMNLDLEYA